MSATTPHPLDPVTRVEVVDLIWPAFDGGTPDRAELEATATRSGARQEVLRLLSHLPNRRFTNPRDLWEELPDVPIDR